MNFSQITISNFHNLHDDSRLCDLFDIKFVGDNNENVEKKLLDSTAKRKQLTKIVLSMENRCDGISLLLILTFYSSLPQIDPMHYEIAHIRADNNPHSLKYHDEQISHVKSQL